MVCFEKHTIFLEHKCAAALNRSFKHTATHYISAAMHNRKRQKIASHPLQKR